MVGSTVVLIYLFAYFRKNRLIRNVIHRIHVMELGLRDMNVGRYLGHNIKQGVNLDASLGFSEGCPLEQTQAEVNGGGVECIELSMQDELPVKPLALRKIDHIVGKLLEYPVVPVRISVGNIAELDVSATESEMVTLVLDGADDAYHLPEAVATGKLSEHHHKKLVPTSESLHVPVTSVLLDYSIKCSLGQKVYELIEDMFSAIHYRLDFLQAAKLRNQFKSTRAVFAYN